jgi:hypothetical protein
MGLITPGGLEMLKITRVQTLFEIEKLLLNKRNMIMRLVNCLLSVIIIYTMSCKVEGQKERISFYKVPLICGADKSIGCGSRIKPLFIDTEKEREIKESWTNKQGTIIAIVWKENENEKLIQSLFKKHDIESTLIFDSMEVKTASADFQEQGKWFKGMEVDQLSIIEAGTIAQNLTQFAQDAKIITPEECQKIRNEIEEYFKKELVKVRTYDELKSPATQEKWKQDGYAIYEKHIGKQRADSVSVLYNKTQGELIEEDSCCDKKDEASCCDKNATVSLKSEITCPKCGHKETETMPTDACVIKYTCKKCKTDLYPKKGDCCVFCTYGNHKCPSKQG